MFEYTLMDFINIYDFMKEWRNWSIFELDNIYPYEFEIYFLQTYADFKMKMELKKGKTK